MRQNEVRTTEHNHTPSSKARQPGRHKSNQIPRGRDQRTNWARAPHGTNRGGKGSNIRQGGEPTTAKKQDRHNGANHPQKGAQHRQRSTNKHAGRNTDRQHHEPRKAKPERDRKVKLRTKDGRESMTQVKAAPEKQT